MDFALLETSDPADMADVRHLFLAYAAELNADLCFQGFEEEIAHLPGKYGPPHGSLWLVRDGASAIACVAIKQIDESTCELKRLYVDPGYRTHGLGERLTIAAMDRATKMGYRTMLLDTLDRLQPAIRLYRRLGFEETTAYYENPLDGVTYMRRALP